MSFLRTPSGLNNQHVFYNVDAVVYVEGGKTSWNKSDVYAGNHNDESIDIVYWRQIFEKFRNDLNLKFKAVGSKNTVSSIALDISQHNLSNVIAAMDSEFDQIFNKVTSHDNIIYTKGYSWENDAWNSNILVEIIRDISGEPIDNNLVENAVDRFFKDVKIGVYADAYLFKKGKSFFPRQGHMKCVCCDLTVVPEVQKPFIGTLITQKGLRRANLYSFGSRYKIEPNELCYGHLLSDYFFHLVRYISQVVLKIKIIHKELLERFAITKFISRMPTSYRTYYANCLNNTVPNKN
ncbi:DUF4435 domain-containing protein [Marinoscillum sp.]|uniref:DUF4435 domain-containing protein n=1 Tax=Marinoscillum sp. TaxID=2024838 RepID=UPI003BAC828B